MIFAVAGTIFGFVLGYLVADAQRDRSPRRETSQTVSPGDPKTSASAPALDPSEVRALSALAGREKDNVRVRVELGNLLMDHDQPEEAVRWYKEALALDPTLNDVRVDMGACLVRLRRNDEAFQTFEEAIKQDPGHKKARFNKGVALMESGKTSEAVAVWEALLKQYPDDPQIAPLRDQIARIRGGAGPF